MLSKLAGFALPPYVKWLAIAALVAFVYLFGSMHGERTAGEHHIAYVEAQAVKTAKVVKAQIQVFTKTETQYRDRIRTIYVKGEDIEKSVPLYITSADTVAYGVNAGFVRVYDAAWGGATAGPAAESDREPAAVSLADVAQADAHNAAACLAWREQALGLREYYRKMQHIFNGDKPATEGTP